MIPSLAAGSASHGSLALKDNHCPPAWGWMGVKDIGRPEGRAQPQRKGFQPVAAQLKVLVWDFGLGVLMLPGAAPIQGSGTEICRCPPGAPHPRDSAREQTQGGTAA